MAFYYSPAAAPGTRWTGTQADARAAQGDRKFITFDMPEAKAARIAWLNTHLVPIGAQAAPAAERIAVDHGAPGGDETVALTYRTGQQHVSDHHIEMVSLDIGPRLAATPAGHALVERPQGAPLDAAALADVLAGALTRLGELGQPAIDALTARLAFDGPAAANKGALVIGAAYADMLRAMAGLKVSKRGPWPAGQDIIGTPAT